MQTIWIFTAVLDDMKNTYREFTGKLKPGGDLILKKGVNIDPLNGTKTPVFSYAVEEECRLFRHTS